MATTSDPDQQILNRAAELLGGQAEYERLAAEEVNEVQRRWNQDTDAIGRILRAHLFVERFMTENLQRANPALGPVEKARLTFAQKIELLNPSDPDVAAAVSGLRAMNRIRNRLAHQSDASVTADDAAALLECQTFSRLLRFRHRGDLNALAPIEVLENFARFAAIALSVRHSRHIAALAAATKELDPGSDA